MKSAANKPRRANEWIEEALIQLMRKQPYDTITVSALARKAGVSRMTYYRNYQSKEAVLTEHALTLSHQFASEMKSALPLGIHKYWELVFAHVYRNRLYFETLIAAGKSSLILDQINVNLAKAEQALNRYEKWYFGGAVYNIIIQWLLSGAKEPIGEMADIVIGLFDKRRTVQIMKDYQCRFAEPTKK